MVLGSIGQFVRDKRFGEGERYAVEDKLGT
jgi:hypothetical protein